MKLFTLFIFVSCCSALFAQQKRITMYKTFGGAVYELNDSISISVKQVKLMLKEVPEAYQEFKTARTKNGMAGGLGFIGGVLVALPLVTAVAGGQPEWIYAGIGGGLIILSVPLLTSYRGHAFNAIDIFNKKQSASARWQANFYFNGTQAGLAIRF
jgi:hypothetical protein